MERQDLDRLLAHVFLNNTLASWVYAIFTTVAIFISIRIVIALILRKMAKSAPATETGWDDVLVDILSRVHWLFLLIMAVYFGSLPLALPGVTTPVIKKAFLIAMLLQIGLVVSYILRSSLDRYRRDKLRRSPEAVTTLSSVSFLLRMLLWVILLLVALDNFGINVTTLIAGLGVGGVAVALAVQNVLGDLFASFSIVLDKPFVIDDFIIVDDYMGTVEYVGLKTTRLRSLSGEQLIFSNTDLLRSRIRNYKRMYQRRVVFSIGVVYNTPVEQLEAVPEMIKQIIESQTPVNFDRAHFKEYGPYSLNFEIVYWIQSPDYNVYMDIQQNINLAIFKRFEQEGIAFAYPTQTLVFDRGSTGERPDPT